MIVESDALLPLPPPPTGPQQQHGCERARLCPAHAVGVGWEARDNPPFPAPTPSPAPTRILPCQGAIKILVFSCRFLQKFVCLTTKLWRIFFISSFFSLKRRFCGENQMHSFWVLNTDPHFESDTDPYPVGKEWTYFNSYLNAKNSALLFHKLWKVAVFS